MLTWLSGRTKAPFMCPTRKWHHYTKDQILQQLYKMRRWFVPGIFPACPCWLTASGTSGEYYCLRQGHCFPATRIVGLKTEGRGQEDGGSRCGGSNNTTWFTKKAAQVLLRLMNGASESLKIRNPCYHITALALSLLCFHWYFLKYLHSVRLL